MHYQNFNISSLFFKFCHYLLLFVIFQLDPLSNCFTEDICPFENSIIMQHLDSTYISFVFIYSIFKLSVLVAKFTLLGGDKRVGLEHLYFVEILLFSGNSVLNSVKSYFYWFIFIFFFKKKNILRLTERIKVPFRCLSGFNFILKVYKINIFCFNFGVHKVE